MATRRSYPDLCGIARSMNVIGERWALLIVRELLFGPKRFNDLLSGLAGASSNVVSQRLRELRTDGVIRRRDIGPPANVQVYELTDWGRELEPILFHLGEWGSTIAPPHDGWISIDSLMLSVAAVARALPAGLIEGVYQLNVGADQFVIEAEDGNFRVRRGTTGAPAATMTTDPGTFRAICLEGRGIAGAQRSGDLTLDGEGVASKRLIDLVLAPFIGDMAGEAPRTSRPPPGEGDERDMSPGRYIRHEDEHFESACTPSSTP